MRTVILLLGFSLPLYHTVRFAQHSDLYSHILLIPFVSLYLGWISRDRFPREDTPPPHAWAALPLTAGVGLLLWAGLLFLSDRVVSQDLLALSMYSLALLIGGLACLSLGRATLRLLAFPLGFLVFLAPFPVFAERELETFLQNGSSVVAFGLFKLAGTPVFNDGNFFRLPGFSLEVAPECSGIHSTVALFITSLVAGQLLLRTPWKRGVLALVVLPIALLRNGVRVVVIGELCVHIGPEMIDSYIHRRGGPIFFALSLVPFLLILYFLLKSDRLGHPKSPPASLS